MQLQMDQGSQQKTWYSKIAREKRTKDNLGKGMVAKQASGNASESR